MNEPQTYVDLQDAGNAQAQLILQAVARHADWNTGECYPSQEAIGVMAKCTDRTVRTYLAKLERDGFITREERRKTNGAKQADLITLVGYKEWITSLRAGGNVAKPKAVQRYEQPENLSGSQPEEFSGAPGKLLSAPPGKQSSGYNKPSLNDHGTKSARAREDSKSDFGSEGDKPKRALPCFTIQPADTSWKHWITHFHDTGRADLADEAERQRRIRVSTRWPSPDSTIFEPNGRKPDSEAAQAVTKRMTGDAA